MLTFAVVSAEDEELHTLVKRVRSSFPHHLVSSSHGGPRQPPYLRLHLEPPVVSSDVDLILSKVRPRLKSFAAFNVSWEAVSVAASSGRPTDALVVLRPAMATQTRLRELEGVVATSLSRAASSTEGPACFDVHIGTYEKAVAADVVERANELLSESSVQDASISAISIGALKPSKCDASVQQHHRHRSLYDDDDDADGAFVWCSMAESSFGSTTRSASPPKAQRKAPLAVKKNSVADNKDALQRAAVEKATSWLTQRRSMESLPKTRTAWEHVLGSFSKVTVTVDAKALIDKFKSNGFLTDAKVWKKTKEKVTMKVIPKATNPNHKVYQRLKTGEAFALKPGESIKTFFNQEEVPAYEIKRTRLGTSFDPACPPVLLGDVDGYQAKLRRCLKHALLSTASASPKRNADGEDTAAVAKPPATIKIPCATFEKILQDASTIRAVVAPDVIFDELVRNGVLIADTSTGAEQFLLSADILRSAA